MSVKKAWKNSIHVKSNQCKGKMACMRICPTEAIRVRNGKAHIFAERCIDCGECLTVCPESAIVPLTNSIIDLSRFRHTIAIPSPAFYLQFDNKVTPDMILRCLPAIGFDSFYDVSIACEATSLAIGRFLENYDGPTPLITPFCPTIVRLVQIKFPDLSELLLPIESPMEIAAREAKEKVVEETGIPPEEIGAIYITPCPVKLTAIHYPPRKIRSFLDGAIAISDVYQSLWIALQEYPKDDNPEPGIDISGIGIGWARLNGLTTSLKGEKNLFVAGLENVIRTFEEIERGQLKDIELVECHSCRGGCISGSLTVENPYVARHRNHSMQAKLGVQPKLDPSHALNDFELKYYSVEKPLHIQPLEPLDNNLTDAIAKLKRKEEIYQSLPGINCGVCGAPTCLAFAEDIVRGHAEETDCFAEKNKHLEELLQQSLKCLRRTPTGKES